MIIKGGRCVGITYITPLYLKTIPNKQELNIGFDK